jgi:two-component system response regulator NreC
MKATKIRLMLVDDHAIVRAGLRSLLAEEPDMEVVGEAANGPEALEKAPQLLPDIILMDLALPGMSGLEATKQIKESLPQQQVLVLTMQDNEEYFLPVLRAGASGYILKESGPQELLSAIRAVHRGGIFLSPAVARVVLGEYLTSAQQGSEKNSYHTLTPREKEVLRLAAQGVKNRDIASSLFISVKTVEKHRANLMAKLGLNSPTQLIRFALQRGLIDPEE